RPPRPGDLPVEGRSVSGGACAGLGGLCLAGVGSGADGGLLLGLAAWAVVGDEAVADVADRSYEGLVLGAALGAEAADVHVHGAGAAEVVVAPDLLQELRAGEDPARVLGEVLQQLELLEGQVEDPSAEAGGVGRLV